MYQSAKSPPLQPALRATNDNENLTLADATLGHLMCALRARLDGMTPARRQLNAKLAAITLVNIANRAAQS